MTSPSPTWNPDLLAQVAGAGGALEWLVEVVAPLTLSSGKRGGFYLPARFSTAPYPDSLQTIVRKSVQVSGQSVTPVSWRYNDMTWRFSVAMSDRATLAQVFRKGQFLRLSVGTPGMLRGDYSPVTSGRVVQVRERNPGQIEVECWGPISSLASRADTSLGRLSIHETYGVKYIDTTGYTAGDATITLTNTTGWEFPAGRYVLIKVTPTTGDVFYLRGTAVTATQVTGLDATGSFGTTAVDAVVGDDVQAIWYDQGRPDVFAARVLTSTATSTNGAYDDLPSHWGYGLPAEWVDTADMVAAGIKLFETDSGTFTGRFRAEATLPADPGAWLTGALATMGAWLSVRMGRITMRGAQDIRSRGAVVYHTGAVITDADVIPKFTSVDWYTQEQSMEWSSTTVTTASDSNVATPGGLYAGTLPARWGTVTYDSSEYVWGNQTDARESMNDRLSPWNGFVGETINVTCRGFRLATLCPGDVVDLASLLVFGRRQQTVLSYGSGLPVMVLAVAVNWTAGTVALRLASLPADRNDEWS
jgi:hypothetical protein